MKLLGVYGKLVSHTPPEHVPLHGLPQAPQLLELVWVLTQAPLQSV